MVSGGSMQSGRKEEEGEERIRSGAMGIFPNEDKKRRRRGASGLLLVHGAAEYSRRGGGLALVKMQACGPPHKVVGQPCES